VALGVQGNNMALLTEEQINDILDIANVCSSSISAKKLIEWNEKQQPHQALPLNWDIAPKWANVATVMVRWDGIGQTDTVTFSRSNRPATPHPHAEILAKYAEVASRRVDPWVEFEFKHKFNKDWAVFICHPHFAVDYEYRHIGDNK